MSKKTKKTLAKMNANKKIEWYSLNKILSHNAPLMFVTSGRGIGKTTAAALWAYKDFINNGNKFFYVRRNDKEKKWAPTLFTKALEITGNKHQVKIKGNIFYIRDSPDTEQLFSQNENGDMIEEVDGSKWRIMGYFMVLSDQQDARGANFHDVNKIIFDEFILENQRQRYLEMEVEMLLQLYSTVDRNENRAKVVCLSNSGAINNPYFAEYEISSKDLMKHGYIKRKGGKVIFEYVDPKPYEALWANSDALAIAPKRWTEMAMNNNFQDVSYVNVEKKPNNAKPILVLHYRNIGWTIYKDVNQSNSLWVSDEIVNLPIDKHYNSDFKSPNADLLFMTKIMRKYFLESIHNNKVKYKTPEAKNGFFDLITNNR